MSGILGYLRILVALPRKQKTLSVENVPCVFEEPYILTGYRPANEAWGYYLLSFFQLHNESVNVWTHSLAFVLVALQVCRMGAFIDFSDNKDAATIIGFSVGVLANLLLSSLAHLLHSKSPWWHYVWFLVDYAGVTCGSFGTCLACMYVSSHPYLYGYMENFYLALNVIMCWLAFVLCCVAKLCFGGSHPKTRKFMMVAGVGTQAFLAALPVLLRYPACLWDEKCSFRSLIPIHVVFFFLICDAVTFSMHFPEKLKPGRYDVFGHGHQIFHVSVLITALVVLYAIQCDIMSGASAHTRPNLNSFLLSYGILFLLELVTLIGMTRLVNKNVEQVQKTAKCD